MRPEVRYFAFAFNGHCLGCGHGLPAKTSAMGLLGALETSITEKSYKYYLKRFDSCCIFQ